MLKPKSIFHVLFLLILLLVGSSSVLLSSITLGATSNPEHITLTWSDDPKSTQTITWQTSASVVGGQVQYAEAVSGSLFPEHAITVAADVTAFNTNSGELAMHSATLSGLKPNTRYIYRVGGPFGWSEPQYFMTAPARAKAFTFLVFGDSQSINYHAWETTLRHAYQANPQAAFFTNVGDLVDVGQDYIHWNSWFSAGKGIIDRIPSMPVAGNHESYSPARRLSMPVYFTEQFRLPPNGPEGLKGQVYSFDYGDVHFVMLDSQEGEQREFVPDLLARQKAWLENDLQSTRKKWKIGFIHRPLYNNKPGEGDVNIAKAFAPIFDKYHMDIVFTGHDHTYARTYPLYAGMKADGTDKGTIYVASGRSGTKTYRNVISKEWNEYFYDPQDEPNYIAVEVGENVIQVKACKQSGELIDNWVINK